MRGLCLAAILGLSSQVALALETWNGDGKMYNASGQQTDNFNVKVEVKDLGNGEEELEIFVYLSSGTITKHCEKKKQGNSWDVTCNDGDGGGVCLDLGQCQEYFIAASGQHYATAITKDGNYMRLLTTILENGQAVGFISQHLAKM